MGQVFCLIEGLIGTGTLFQQCFTSLVWRFLGDNVRTYAQIAKKMKTLQYQILNILRYIMISLSVRNIK